jgi:hypothetical protein
LIDQNFAANFLKKVTQKKLCEIISKTDLPFDRRREENFQEFHHVCICASSPHYQSHVSRFINISQTISEKGHQRKISVKLF